MKRSLTIILLIFAVFLLHACKAERAESPARGTVPRVGISLATKASGLGEADARDGYAFHNVLIVLADLSGKVVAAPVYKEYPYINAGSDDPQISVDDEYPEKDVIYFENVEIGEYTVYAYANIDHTAWQDGNIASVEKALAVGSTLDADRLLATISDCSQLAEAKFDGQKAVPDTSMLLTGSNGLSVGVTNTSCTVELLRPVCRLNVYINNHADVPVTLTDLSFSKFAASSSYLFDHRTSEGLPTIPAGNTYIDLPGISSGSIVIPADGTDTLVYSTLLYENNAPIEYKIYGKVKRDDKEQIIHSIPGARLITRDELMGMAVGDSMTVLLCNPSTNSGMGRFFGYYGTGLVDLKPSARSKEAFQEYAVYNILNNDSQRAKYLLTLTKHADNNYSLKHSGSGYNIMSIVNKDTANWKPKDDSSGIFIFKPGSTSHSNILDSFADNVVLVKNNITNPYKLLQNGGNGTLTDASESTTNATNHNAQWVFYEAYDINKEGDLLKLVDNETSKVTPLTSMLRNQELNVILNVYYHNTPGSFNFYVDNTYWGDKGHSAGHIFK